MPDRSLSPPSVPTTIILHDRRLRLSTSQAHMLAVLLAHAGHIVSDAELLSCQQGTKRAPRNLWHAVSHLRAVIAPHGFTIARVRPAGYRLRPEEESS